MKTLTTACALLASAFLSAPATADCSQTAVKAVAELEALNQETDDSTDRTVNFVKDVKLTKLEEQGELYRIESRGYYDITGHYEVVTASFPGNRCYIVKLELTHVTD